VLSARWQSLLVGVFAGDIDWQRVAP